MSDQKTISGFSKLSKTGKIRWIVENFFKDPEAVIHELESYWHSNEDQQRILDNFSENTISNFPMPYGVAPNFVIDGRTYVIPMVIEESSVVAAASSAAKYWMKRGGFKTRIFDTVKLGQVHFKWKGDKDILFAHFDDLKEKLATDAQSITKSMEERGGGILDFDLIDYTDKMPHLYQLMVSFETCDSMGANFINTCLEQFSQSILDYFESDTHYSGKARDVEIIMSILSNYTPDCLVEARVECPIEDLGRINKSMEAEEFARRFHDAVQIAHFDEFRATTHNKGIFNGIDAIAIATGNDFRAIEACGHTYASRNGRYTSLSHCSLDNGVFSFWLTMPLALGTVGGLTSLHPFAKRSIELLGHPDAGSLMRIFAATGLAQNFAALRSLVTVGIQKGHMKMHLKNILHQLNANPVEEHAAVEYFRNKIVSFSAVKDYLEGSRMNLANSKPTQKS